jgi:hypothetical protein
LDKRYSPCSAELISTAYQPWNSVFLSHQISHSRLISQKTACRTGPLIVIINLLAAMIFLSEIKLLRVFETAERINFYVVAVGNSM